MFLPEGNIDREGEETKLIEKNLMNKTGRNYCGGNILAYRDEDQK